MKTCRMCGVEKGLSEFHTCSGNKDGLHNSCRPCHREAAAASARKSRATPEGRAKSQAASASYRRKSREDPEWRAKHQAYKRQSYHANPTTARERAAQYQKTRADPVKLQARWTLNNAVQRRHITKPDTCEHCGTGGLIHGHHHDYTKAFDVKWLCPPCHGLEHRKCDLEVIHEHQTNCSLSSGCPSLAGG